METQLRKIVEFGIGAMPKQSGAINAGFLEN
jgi:hypothetical protein